MYSPTVICPIAARPPAVFPVNLRLNKFLVVVCRQEGRGDQRNDSSNLHWQFA